MPKLIKHIERVCPTCKKVFYVRPKIAEKGQGVYCSRNCFNPPLIKICLNCKKEFRTSPAQDHDYCSQKCAWSSPIRNSKVGEKQSALHSKPEFRIKFLEWIKERTASEHWRSSKHFQKGEAHPAYKGNASARETAMGGYEYKKWRTDVFKRDNYTCQKCNTKGGVLRAHHIKEWAKYPEHRFDIDNGLTVCETCHKEIHKKK